MIVTSICDPAVFDPSLLENKYATSSLTAALRNMAQYHLPVVDSCNAIAMATLKRLQEHPALQMRYNALLQPDRIVHVPADASRIQQLEEWIGSESATAVACSENPLVDVLLASDDTLVAMEEEKIDHRKTVALHNFSGSCWYKDGKSKAIGGMTKEEFLSEIIRPVVRCARKVTIIDKMVSRAAFGLRSTNWDSFKQTIRLIHGEWEKGLYRGDGTFEVITAHETNARLNGKTILGNDQAKAIGAKLGIPQPQLLVLLHSEHKFDSKMHARYLVTNQDIVLGFEKGFDLSTAETLGICDVYLRKYDELIRKLMYKENNNGLQEPKKK
jgi:hypothetical protein